MRASRQLARADRPPRRRSAGRRSRWWRCGPTARSSRWSAAAIMRESAVQPRHPGAPPARLDLQAVRLSRRACAPGMEPDDAIDDTPIEIGDWRPNNYGGRYRGTLTLRDAFARRATSRRCGCSERVGARGRDRGGARPRRAQPARRPIPSLALGTSAMTLLELTAAYAAVAGRRLSGAAARPRRRADAVRGSAAGSTRRDEPSSRVRRACATCCGGRRSTTAPAARRRCAVPTFGKTGTSQDNRDALFVGFAGDLVVGVWVGNDDNSAARPAVAGRRPAGADLARLHDPGAAQRRDPARPRQSVRGSALPLRAGRGARPAAGGARRRDGAIGARARSRGGTVGTVDAGEPRSPLGAQARHGPGQEPRPRLKGIGVSGAARRRGEPREL